MTPETTESQVLAVEAVRAKAMADADIATLERITGEDSVHLESSGQVRTKAEFLDGLRRGDYRFESFVVDENHARIFGETAVVTES